MYNFDFVKPGSIADAAAALGDEDAQPIAGGQTLIPTLKQRLAQPSRLVSLTGIAEMVGICEENQGRLCIGASTTQAQNAVAAEAVRIVNAYMNEGEAPNCVNLCDKTPAGWLLVVRHRDVVGVLAGILMELKKDAINVQEMENVVFSGAKAACAKIQLDKAPSQELLDTIQSNSDHILALALTELS